MKTVMTHGTFDVLHHGHIKFLKAARALGDRLIVSLTSDKTAVEYGKKNINDFQSRKEVLEAVRFVDLVVEGNKVVRSEEAKEYGVDVFATSEDYKDTDYSNFPCEVVLLKRTQGISSSDIKRKIREG